MVTPPVVLTGAEVAPVVTGNPPVVASPVVLVDVLVPVVVGMSEEHCTGVESLPATKLTLPQASNVQ